MLWEAPPPKPGPNVVLPTLEEESQEWNEHFTILMQKKSLGPQQRIKKVVAEVPRLGCLDFLRSFDLSVWSGFGLRRSRSVWCGMPNGCVAVDTDCHWPPRDGFTKHRVMLYAFPSATTEMAL